MTPHEPDGFRHGPLYLDHNATTPVDPRVVAAMLPYLRIHFGNPSSDHHYGQESKDAMARARNQVASLIGARADEVVFMGSGSESAAAAIRGALTAARGSGITRPHVITQATEHPAVLAACAYAERHHGAEVTTLTVDSDGVLDPATLSMALRPQTVLVSVMHANNETGVIQPIPELARIAHGHGTLFHSDAAQTVGKIPVNVAELGVDLLTVVGHKMYAPKGVAALYIREGVHLEAIIGGGGQESGRRAGTENVPHAVALGAAAGIAAAEIECGSAGHLRALRDQLQYHLESRLPGRVHLNGHPTKRLPQTLNIHVDGVEGHRVLASCDAVAASTGSACHEGEHSPSPVLTAMGHGPERALSALRLSLGRWTTFEDVAEAARALVDAIEAQAL